MIFRTWRQVWMVQAVDYIGWKLYETIFFEVREDTRAA